MACQICHDLSLHQVIVVASLHDAIANQTSSCETCLLLSTIVKQFNLSDEKIVLATKSKWTNRGLEQKLQIQGIPPPFRSYPRAKAPEVVPSTLIDVFYAPHSEVPYPAIQPGRMIASHSSSDHSFARAAAWIKDCEESHKFSCSTSRTSLLPKRVIDVIGRSVDGAPFLLESGGQYGRYATLSYCWGTTDQEKLVSANVEAFKKALPISTLSKTVTDAIMICKILRIQYLWIDALCILQDDNEDWISQSNQMRQVYSESFLTLAASSTADCSKGIFATQSRASQLVKVKLRDESVYARVSPHSHLEHIGPFFIKDMSESDILRRNNELLRRQYELLPLCRRGWTLQERVMSNRVLYYTNEELWWECNECVQCECGGPEELPTTASYRWLRNPLLKELVVTQEMAYQQWRDLATLFSTGALMRPGDKFPAISGLAKQFEVMLWHRFKEKDIYIAGLWKSQLATDLLWNTLPTSKESNIRSPCRPAEWRAPTWSWASVDGIIQFPPENGRQSRYFLTVIDVSVETSTKDIHGALFGGQIVLEGPSLRFSMRINCNTDKTGYTLALPPGTSVPYQFEETTFFPDGCGSEFVSGTEYFYLLAGGYPRYKTLPDDLNSLVTVEGSSYAQFLVLRRINGTAEERYERIGFAICRMDVALSEMETCELLVERRIIVV
jgi:hypothetical protein